MTMKLSKANKTVKAILARTFPEYAGRRVQARIATTYYVENMWGGGTRAFAKALHVESGAVNEAAQAIGTVEIPSGVVIVEHAFFCGQDAGITIVVRPDDLQRALPSAANAGALAEAR